MSGTATSPEAGGGEGAVVAGERGATVVARARSVQARLRQGLAGLVLALIAAAFLAWYYTRLAGAEPLHGSAAERASAAARE